MQRCSARFQTELAVATKPSPRTRHCELLRLCARIGYSPHAPI